MNEHKQRDADLIDLLNKHDIRKIWGLVKHKNGRVGFINAEKENELEDEDSFDFLTNLNYVTMQIIDKAVANNIDPEKLKEITMFDMVKLAKEKTIQNSSEKATSGILANIRAGVR